MRLLCVNAEAYDTNYVLSRSCKSAGPQLMQIHVSYAIAYRATNTDNTLSGRVTP